MTNRPIPRRGLLGAWFLDDRGITYDAGQNQAIDRSGQGNHATYKNGVTVGVEGDPAREFGASVFDASSSQFVDTDAPLEPSEFATVIIIKNGQFNNQGRFFSTEDPSFENGSSLVDTQEGYSFRVNSSSGTTEIVAPQKDKYEVLTLSFKDNKASVFEGQELVDSKSATHDLPLSDLQIMSIAYKADNFANGEIAAVARYDLTVPNAPEPSEIARKWDKLRDIPATR